MVWVDFAASQETASAPTTSPAADVAIGSGAAAGGEGGAGAAGADYARRVHSKHKHTPYRGDDGRGKRPRKGDAKRERRKKALAKAAEACRYYVDDHGTTSYFLNANESCCCTPPASPKYCCVHDFAGVGPVVARHTHTHTLERAAAHMKPRNRPRACVERPTESWKTRCPVLRDRFVQAHSAAICPAFEPREITKSPPMPTRAPLSHK